MTILKKISIPYLLFTIFLLGVVTIVQAQNDKIEGLWYNDVKDAKIEIYKAGDGKFYGKIVWLKEPLKNGKPKLDEKNPVESRQRQTLLSLIILKGFQKKGDTYTEGTIYDPENGKVYDCKMTYNGKNLSIRGFIGFSFLGRTTVWERAS
jgi:uncharacterized protein (DUF2147 family)